MDLTPKLPRNTDLRRRILDLLATQPAGLTAREIADHFQIDVRLVRPRVSELKRAGKIRPVDGVRRRKLANNGRGSAVMVLTEG